MSASKANVLDIINTHTNGSGLDDFKEKLKFEND